MNKYTTGIFSTAIALLCATLPASAGTVSPIPEPTTVLLMGGGLGAILVIRHMRAKKK